MKPIFLLFPGTLTLLGVLTACGGSSHHNPPTASALTYTDPTDTSGFYLKADPATNGTPNLVLHLMAGHRLQIQGVSFYLTVDPGLATWAKRGSAPYYASNGSTFNLGTGSQPFVARVSGGDLQVGVFQPQGDVWVGSAPLVDISLTCNPGVKPGTVVPLTVTSGTQAVYTYASGSVLPFDAPIAVGKLTAQ